MPLHLLADGQPISRIAGRRNRAVRRPAGWSERTGVNGEVVHGDMLQCCHCQFTWIVQEGSERMRGWCFRCANSKRGTGHLCGKPECMRECIPWELRVENVEAGLNPLTLPTAKISVPSLEAVGELAIKPGQILIPDSAAFELEASGVHLEEAPACFS